MKKTSKVKVDENLRESILKAVDEIGGFKKFIKNGETILLKPNFNTADPFPGSTDSEFLRTVVGLFYENGAGKVIVGGSSTFMADSRKVMEKLRVFYLEKATPPVQVVVFDEEKWVKKKIPDSKHLKNVFLPKILDEVDKLILLPCLKTHFLAQFTGALKLSVGFVKPNQRLKLHIHNLQDKIAELNKIINPNLIIMDARKIFINKGPANGEIREPNFILASESRVDIDIEGVKIIKSFKGNSLRDIKPEELFQIKTAIKIGID